MQAPLCACSVHPQYDYYIRTLPTIQWYERRCCFWLRYTLLMFHIYKFALRIHGLPIAQLTVEWCSCHFMIDALKCERAFSVKSIMFISFYQYNINLHVFSSFAYSMPAQTPYLSKWHSIFNTQKHGNRYANYLANAFIMRVLSCLYETYFLTGNSTLSDDKLSNVQKNVK